ncbi:MAG: hypothetical protein WA902_24245 [Thermosynechococcaceae cyanobacterium]
MLLCRYVTIPQRNILVVLIQMMLWRTIAICQRCVRTQIELGEIMPWWLSRNEMPLGRGGQATVAMATVAMAIMTRLTMV